MLQQKYVMEYSIMDNTENIAAIGLTQTNPWGDIFFANLNGRTFNKIGATTLFEHEFSNILFETSKLYVIVGTDSGLLPQYIQTKGIPKGTRYLFVEPTLVLNELQEEDVLSNLSDSIAFADETNWLQALAHFKIRDYFYIDGVQPQTALCAKEDNLGLYAELSWQIVEHLKQFQYQTYRSISSRSFIVQQLLNLADNQYPTALLKEAFKGKTAFILGGGTSLDNALPWLVANRSSIVLIVVSRIAKRLLDFGLEPDFICSIDPHPVNWSVSKELYLLSSRAILVHSYHLYHSLLSQWPGRSFYCGDRVPWKSELNEENVASAGPTVTNFAIHFAVQLGFNSVYLAGVDYCFSLDGFTHAQGSYEAAVGARFNLSGSVVETYQGVMAPTGLDYLGARDTLEAQMKHYDTTQFYNVAPTAAKVAGVHYCPLDSIELEPTPIDVLTIVNSCNSAMNLERFFSQIHQEAQHRIHQLKEIRKLAEEALQCNKTLYNSEGVIENYKDKLHLDKIERIIDKKYKKLSFLVKRFGIGQFLKITKPFSDSEQLTSEDVKTGLAIYYQSYIEGSTQLIKVLERSIIHINARTEEHKTKPDWSFLIDYCHKEKCFGRVRLWRQLESAQHLNAAHQEHFNEFERLFIEEIAKIPPLAETVKHASNLSFLKSRAQILFKHQQKELLQHLLLA